MSCVMYVICNLSCPSSSLLLMHKSWPNGSAAWGLMFVGTLASANTGATHWQDHDDDDGDDGGVYDDDNCESIVMFLGTLASATTRATHWQDHHRLLPFHHPRKGIVIRIFWNATKSIIDRFTVNC